MAREELDETANEALSSTLAKLNRMTTTLYAADSSDPDPSFTSVTVSGLSALASATLSSTLAVTGTSTLAAADATNITASGTLAVTGASTLAAVSATTVTGSGLATVATLKLDTSTKTASATAGAATLAKAAGVITSEGLTTAAGDTYTLTLTNSTIAAADQVFASVSLGTATTGMPVVTTVTPGVDSVVIIVQNVHASAALDGTIKIAFMVLKN